MYVFAYYLIGSQAFATIPALDQTSTKSALHQDLFITQNNHVSLQKLPLAVLGETFSSQLLFQSMLSVLSG